MEIIGTKIAKHNTKRTYIKSLLELCGSIISLSSRRSRQRRQKSNVKLLNLSVNCEFDVLVVFACDFFQFFYILVTFHLTAVFIKNLSLNGVT
jgi:hypothetical protein